MKMRSKILVKYLIILICFLVPVVGNAYGSQASDLDEYEEQMATDLTSEQDEPTKDELDIYSSFYNIGGKQRELNEILAESDTASNYVTPVHDLGIKVVTSTEIGIAWASTVAAKNSVWYEIYANDVRVSTINGTETNYTFKSCMPNTIYRIKIRTVSKTDPTNYVDSNTVTVVTSLKLTPVSDLGYISTTNNSITVKWENTVTNHKDVWHRVFVNGVLNQYVTGEITNLTIFNLDASTTYQIYVVTELKSDSSICAQSETVMLRTNSPEVVIPVSNLRVGSKTPVPGTNGYSVILEWDNTMGAAADVYYELYVNGEILATIPAYYESMTYPVMIFPGKTCYFHMVSIQPSTGIVSDPSNTVPASVADFESSDISDVNVDLELTGKTAITEAEGDNGQLVNEIVIDGASLLDAAEAVEEILTTSITNRHGEEALENTIERLDNELY